MSCFQVLDGTSAAKIEQIGSDAAVACAASLALGDVSKAMFYNDTLSQQASAFRRRDQLSQSVLEALVFGERDRSAAVRGHRALRSQMASAARFRIEFHCHAGCERFYLSRRAGDGEPAHIDVKVADALAAGVIGVRSKSCVSRSCNV